MLRSLFVLGLLGVGSLYALQGPFQALLVYVGYAYFRPEQWVWVDFISGMRLSLVFGTYVVVATALSRRAVFWNSKTTLLFSFLALAILSTWLGDDAAYSWPYLIEFTKAVVITYMIVLLVDDYSKFRLFVLVMVMALGLEQAKQGWVYFLSSPGQPNRNSVPFLGDNNGVAVGMLMLIPWVEFLILTAKNRYAKIFYRVLQIGCLYRGLSTYSRGGFLAAIALGTMWFFGSQHKMKVALQICALALVVGVSLPETFWERMGTIQNYEELEDQSALGRLHFWEVAVAMANENPVLGIGFNGYNAAYDNYDSSNGSYGKGRSVHSSFFGVLAEMGYVGLALYVAILFAAWHSCSEVRRWAEKHGDRQGIGAGAGAVQKSLVVFAVGGSFVPFQYNEMLWHVIGLSIALERIAGREVNGKELGSQAGHLAAA